MRDQGIHILMISVHGLIRGREPELGRDPDTGGQVLFVLELMRALARDPAVAQVDLLTRLVEDPSVGPDYACPVENLGPHARILRLPFGPRRYLRKEILWNHLDHLVDRTLALARDLPRLPDILHSHYADAGYVAQRLGSLLGIPFVHTGHSLGRCKLQRLLDAGGREGPLERTYHFARRIGVEEEVLAHAQAVLASTRQEVVEQYGLYRHFSPSKASILPPGTDTSRFSPPRWRVTERAVAPRVDKFLADPRKPLVLCISRPAPAKNLAGLVQAFGRDPVLRERANLLLVAGNREDLRDLDDTSRATWEELLATLDRYDLFGSVALPKTHGSEDIPEFYRLAARRRGLYVAPSFSESFGLTLIEAAASGLPVVATDGGGPKDILANCRNGLLVDVTDTRGLGLALREALLDADRWAQWSRNGLRGVRRHYTWEAHVARYLALLEGILHRNRKRRRKDLAWTQAGTAGPTPFLHARTVLVCDLDGTLLGDPEGLAELRSWIEARRPGLSFCVATGRKLASALWILRTWNVPMPDVLVTSVGTEIHYGSPDRPDAGWESRLRQDWRREELARLLEGIPGLRLQGRRRQGPTKLSYHVNPARMPDLEALRDLLHGAGLKANLVYSQARHLDLVPYQASKGQALRYLAYRWGIPLERFLVAGDSGNDRDMLVGDMLGIVVGNHSPELAQLRGRSRIYFAQGASARGILEGIRHYQFRQLLPGLDGDS